MQVKDRERSNGTVQPVDMRPDWILEHTRLGVILQQWDGDLLLNLQYGSFLRLLIDAFGGHILLLKTPIGIQLNVQEKALCQGLINFSFKNGFWSSQNWPKRTKRGRLRRF
jgi:hypothetical protein